MLSRRTLTLFLLIFLVAPVKAGPISITTISDLHFGIGFPGDGTKVVPPDNVETAENASFLITGDPNRRFRITLPRRINMNSPNGTHSIRVRRFRSSPSRRGRLDATGRAFLYIGATRNAIGANVESGLYRGVFTVTVIY